MSQPVVDDLITKLNSLSLNERKKIVAGMTSGSYGSIIYRNSLRRVRKKHSSRTLLWHGILIDLRNNPYITDTQNLWRLESLIGTRKLNRMIKRKPRLDSESIENLFAGVPFQLYGNENETFLLSVKNELMEADFGPLHTITPLDALKRFGLDMLETAKEKGYVRVRAQ